MAILTDLRDPRIEDVTVTYVEVSPDMRQAKVHVSIMGDDAKQRLCLHGLRSSAGYLQSKIADRIAMLEHSIYSVISPEGCASILWKDAEKMREAAEALRLTAQDLLALGVIDRIVPEPKGGAQRDKPETIARVGAAIGELLGELDGRKPAELRKARRKKFLDMGQKSLVA